jgi:hypothetical protein
MGRQAEKTFRSSDNRQVWALLRYRSNGVGARSPIIIVPSDLCGTQFENAAGHLGGGSDMSLARYSGRLDVRGRAGSKAQWGPAKRIVRARASNRSSTSGAFDPVGVTLS